ncbi:hypothetical protein APM_3439 [Acidiphilium sp. PM]|nr:hypothetical protein APM_3439 [Acidiphilium sp. PM]
MAIPDSQTEHGAASASRRTTPVAALAALGIVYGDLGTSPLYTMQTVISDAGGPSIRNWRSAFCH